MIRRPMFRALVFSQSELGNCSALMPLGLRVPVCKIDFCSTFLRLSVLPRWRERPQTAMCFQYAGLGRLKCCATAVEASALSLISTSLRCSRNGHFMSVFQDEMPMNGCLLKSGAK